MLTFLTFACDSEGPFPPGTTTAVPASTIQGLIPILDWDFEEGVYIAGNAYSKQRDIAQVCGNGKVQVITEGELGTMATSISVSGDEVFLTGYEYYWDSYPDKGVFWKNGVAQPLTDGNHEAGSFSIFALNNDVYIAGYDSSVAMLWKNGVPIPLSDGTVPTRATSLFVSNGDVYVVGNELHDDFNKAILWKNDKPQYLRGVQVQPLYLYPAMMYMSQVVMDIAVWYGSTEYKRYFLLTVIIPLLYLYT